MHRPLAALLLTTLLPLQALAQPFGLAECRALRERRNQLAAEAMQAEISLVLATRRRLCPRQEALAEQANANTPAASEASTHASSKAGSEANATTTNSTNTNTNINPNINPNTSAARQADAPELDYTAYLRCRRQAEQQLQRSRVVLYTNQNGFNFYTLEGARLAREADGLHAQLLEGCEKAAATGALR